MVAGGVGGAGGALFLGGGGGGLALPFERETEICRVQGSRVWGLGFQGRVSGLGLRV